MGIIGGVEKTIENAQNIYNNLLIPVQSVERALDSTDDGALCLKTKICLTVTVS